MLKEETADEAFAEATSRREFLLYSQRLLFSAAVLTLSPFSLRASDMPGLNLQHLDTSSALMLAELSRLLFPHDKLADSVYLDVVKDIDADMQVRGETRELIKQLPALLNTKAGGDWLSTGTGQKLGVLKSLEGSEMFAYLHKRTIDSLYRNPAVWKLVGYQGSSIEHGGYLHRGFDDIDWLEN
jgi:hypothetical protein